MDPHAFATILWTLSGVVVGVVGDRIYVLTSRRMDRHETYERGYRAGQRFANDKQRQMRPPRPNRIELSDAPKDQKMRVTRARISKPRRPGSNHS